MSRESKTSLEVDRDFSNKLKVIEMLFLLDVDIAGSKKPYDRSLFKYGNTDEDGDCMRVRHEVLARDSLLEVRLSERSSPCTVQVTGGQWLSLYDNAVTDDPDTLQIDHIVSLKEAWISGASLWSDEKLEQFGNDLGFEGSLIAVTSKLNGMAEKGDKDPKRWLPDFNKCQFAQNYVAVKYRWGLSVDQAERDVLVNLLNGKCGDQIVDVSTAP